MKIALFANTDWYLYNFRLPLAVSLRGKGHSVVLICPPGQYCEKLAGVGFRVIEVNMRRRSINPLTSVVFVYRLVQIYRTEKFDLVHHFTLKCVIFGSLSAQLAHIDAVVNAVAGLGYVFTSNSLFSKSLRPFLRYLLLTSHKSPKARLIVQNPDDQAEFVDNNLVPLNKIRLILSSGVNINRFTPEIRVNTEGRPLRILMATRLLWEKGLEEYIGAAEQIRSKFRNVEILLAGSIDEGNPGSVTMKEIAEWNETSHITYLGHIDDIATLLSTIDIAVLPSYREGVPRFLLESAAMGLPIVTTDAPGCREVVINNVNGLLVPIKDIGALSDAILLLLNDSKKRSSMGYQSRIIAVNFFSEDIVLEKTLRVYDELIHL